MANRPKTQAEEQNQAATPEANVNAEESDRQPGEAAAEDARQDNLPADPMAPPVQSVESEPTTSVAVPVPWVETVTALAGVPAECSPYVAGSGVATAVLVILSTTAVSKLLGRLQRWRGKASKPGKAPDAATGKKDQAEETSATALKGQLQDAERTAQAAEAKAAQAQRDLESARREMTNLEKKLARSEAARRKAEAGAAAAGTEAATAAVGSGAPSTAAGSATEGSAPTSGNLEAELAQVKSERDNYLAQWTEAYQSYVALSQELAQREQALAETQQQLTVALASSKSADGQPPAASPATSAADSAAESSATSAATKARLTELEQTLAARESELTQLRSQLATLVPDAEEQKQLYEKERGRANELEAQSGRLTANIKALDIDVQRCKVEIEDLRKQLKAKDAKLQVFEKGGQAAQGLPAAERDELKEQLASVQHQLDILEIGHKDFLKFHHEQITDRERKLENFEEFFSKHSQQQSGKVQELEKK